MSMKHIRGVVLIRQKHSKGCGIAAIAMLADWEYDEIKTRLYGTRGEIAGLFYNEVLEVGCELGGFEVHSEVYPHQADETHRANVMKPYADVHLVEIKVFKDSPCLHFIIMDEDGKLYDPMFGMTTWDWYCEPPSQIIGLKLKTP